MNIPEEDYERLAAVITSENSPVGIDAKRTHIMILRKLELIEERLTRIEGGWAAKGSPHSTEPSN